jgi:hypothetical protein
MMAKGVKHFKKEGGRKIMCEAVERYGDRREEARRKDIARMLGKGKTPEENK